MSAHAMTTARLLALVVAGSMAGCLGMPRTGSVPEIENPLPDVRWAEARAYWSGREQRYAPRVKRVAEDGRVWFESFGAWDGPPPPADATIEPADARRFIEDAYAAYAALEEIQCGVDHTDAFAIELVDETGVARQLEGCGPKYRRRVGALLR